MNKTKFCKFQCLFQNALLSILLLYPSVTMAHPGHYHPGEEDEFSELSANYLHVHGYLEFSLLMVVLVAAAVFKINKNSRIRTASVLAFGGSLALLIAL